MTVKDELSGEELDLREPFRVTDPLPAAESERTGVWGSGRPDGSLRNARYSDAGGAAGRLPAGSSTGAGVSGLRGGLGGFLDGHCFGDLVDDRAAARLDDRQAEARDHEERGQDGRGPGQHGGRAPGARPSTRRQFPTANRSFRPYGKH